MSYKPKYKSQRGYCCVQYETCIKIIPYLIE